MSGCSPYPKWMKLEGSYTALVFGLSLPKSNVRRMLPAGLALADNPMSTPGEHPVFFFAGHQYDVQMSGLLRFLFKMDYLEHITLVPYVTMTRERRCCKGPDTVFQYAPRLFLNDALPTIGGRLFWGLTKSLAEITKRSGHYQVNGYVTGSPILALDYQLEGRPGRPSTFPNFAPMAGMFELPNVEQDILGVAGPYICSKFDWHLDEAMIQPIRGNFVLTQSYLRGLVPDAYEVRSIIERPWGAFRLTTRWTYSMPYWC